MYCILADPATKERAPVKSTSVHPNFVMAHDLMVLEVEIGSTPWPAVDEVRSPERQMQPPELERVTPCVFNLGPSRSFGWTFHCRRIKTKKGG
jgi:hypothetical protein